MAENGATIFGLPKLSITWNPDFKATKDYKNKWSGSESFTLNADDVIRFIPTINSPCQHEGFSFMKVSSVDISNNEGNTYVITCNYGGVTTSDDLSGSEDITENTLSSLSSLSSSEVTNQYTFAENSASSGLGITTSEEPIEKHYKFRGISDYEMMVIQNIKSGTFTRVELESYTYKNSSDKTIGGETYKVETEMGIKLLEYVLKGVESYYSPRQVFTKSYTSANLPDVGRVGKISSAPGVTGGGPTDWLYNGVNAQRHGGVYEITKEFIKSGQGGWDEFLYS